jgi:hypothetical protein
MPGGASMIRDSYISAAKETILSLIDAPALEDQCWNPPTRALRDGERTQSSPDSNETNSQFFDSEDNGVPPKLCCGRSRVSDLVAVLAQNKAPKPGPLTKVPRKRAHVQREEASHLVF